MDIRVSRLGAATYVTPDGALTNASIAAFKSRIDTLREEGRLDVVVNLEQVTVLDSMALETLVDLFTALSEAGGSLRLTNANPLCRQILLITRVIDTIPLLDDLESAGRSFL